MKAISRVRWLGAIALPLLFLACDDSNTSKPAAKVEIVAFGASPSMVTVEGSATLNWITTNAKSVVIVDDEDTPLDLRGAPPEMGSVTVQPGKTRSYRLFAKGPGGEASREATVVVLAEGVAAKLWVEPELVSYGEKGTLHWETQHAGFVTITQDGKTIVSSAAELAGTKEIESLDSLEFAIEASGPLGTATATANLRVKPLIEELSTPQVKPVYPGENVEIRWVTKGADALRVSNLDGWEQDVPKQSVGKGSLVAKVGRDGTFRLVASRAGVEEASELAVELAGPPSIVRFVAEPGGITEGKGVAESVRLSWHLGNAKSIRLESDHHGVIDVSGKKSTFDSVDVANVPAGTVFTLRASNASATTEENLSFDAVPLARVEEFRAVPARVGGEEPVTLVWKTEGATEIELRAGELRLAVNRHQVDGRFETTVKGNASFDLTAKNPGGDPVFERLEILLGAPQVSFSTAKPQVRPGGDITFRWKNLGGNLLRILQGGAVVHESEDVWHIDSGEVTIQASTTEGYFKYELEVSNKLGKGTSTVDLLVSDGPEIVSFDVTPGPVKAGDQVTFAWVVKNDRLGNVPSLELVDDLGEEYDVSAEDPNEGTISIPISSAGVRTFTLRASTAGSLPSIALASSKIYGDPEIDFAAQPDKYDPFNKIPVRLTWQVRYASRLWLHRIDESGTIQETLLQSARESTVARSFQDVVPQRPGQWYRLEVENPWGDRAHADFYAEYMVPTIRSFDVSTTTVSKGGSVTVSWDTGGGKTFVNGPLQPTAMTEVTGSTLVSINGLSGTSTVTSSMLNCNTGIGANTDEGCTTITFPSGFTFPFDGALRTRARMGTNGWVGFDPSVTGPGSIFSTMETYSYPTTNAIWGQLIPFGADLWNPTGYFWREESTAAGRSIVFQWQVGSPGTTLLQVVLWESGAFEYRYGNTMVASRTYSMGFQNMNATVGWNMSSKPVSGSLVNRTWRYEPLYSPVGSFKVNLNETTTFRVCVYGEGTEKVCQDKIVSVTN